jgi:hypothetical protein
MKLVIWALAITGSMVALGLLYRLAAVAYFILFTYIFTLEEGVCHTLTHSHTHEIHTHEIHSVDTTNTNVLPSCDDGWYR